MTWRYCPGCEREVARKMFPSRQRLCSDCRADSDRLRRYGVTPEEYAALLDNCHGLCTICKSSDPLIVDHNHSTGNVRGLLCNSCNTGLGLFRDNPELLAHAVDYLHEYS